MPPGKIAPAGHMIHRNPGCVLVWTTRRYRTFSDGRGGALFDVGEPTRVAWYREGRTATRAEVLESIESGLPILRELAQEDGPAGAIDLERRYRLVEPLLPAS